MSKPRPEPIWTRPQPGSRSPRFDRDKIAAAAMRVADEDGMAAVSMRRVASELGAGTMTLYHYVANKAELLELMGDAMMSELLVEQSELEGEWRTALTAIAYASLQTFRRHGWLTDPSSGVESFGPNGMEHFEQSMAAASGTGLPMDQRLEIVSQIDDYVLGFVLRENDLFSRPDEEGWDEAIRPISDYFNQLLETGRYPNVEEFLGGDDFPTVVRRMVATMSSDARFERSLQRLLDGVELEIERHADGA